MSTSGITHATITTHESASKRRRNAQPPKIAAQSFAKFASSPRPASVKPIAASTSTTAAGKSQRARQTGHPVSPRISLPRRPAQREDPLRLDDMQLAEEKGPRLVLVAVGELDAVRPVDRHRIDVQALQRLEYRVAGAAVERNALLELRRARRVLQQEDVPER